MRIFFVEFEDAAGQVVAGLIDCWFSEKGCWNHQHQGRCLLDGESVSRASAGMMPW